MHRFYAASDKIRDGRVILTGPEAQHLKNVLRLRNGDQVEVLDGAGKCYRVRLLNVGSREVIGEVESWVESAAESPLRIFMGQALLKGRSHEPVLRQAVELGVEAIAPVCARRCIPRLASGKAAAKGERWRRIALEAAKQCGRAKVPRVEEPLSVEAFCRQARDHDLKLLFWEKEERRGLADLPRGGAVETLAFLAGPEGGWDQEEIDLATGFGFETVSLGPRTLRAETAPTVILALLQYLWGDLGGKR